MTGPSHKQDDAPLRCSAQPRRHAVGWCTHCHQPFGEAWLLVRTDGRAICRGCRGALGADVLDPSVLRERDPLRRLGWWKSAWHLLRAPHTRVAALLNAEGGRIARYAYAWSLVGSVAWLAWAIALEPQLLERLVESRPELASRPRAELLGWLALAMPLVTMVRLAAGLLALRVVAALSGYDREAWRPFARLFGLSQAATLLCMVPTFLGPLAFSAFWAMIMMAGLRVLGVQSLGKSFVFLLPTGIAMLSWGPHPLPLVGG